MRMANYLLISPLHLIQSDMGQEVEAKPERSTPRERSQGCTAMCSHEVAGLSSQTGLPLGCCCGRVSPFRAKSASPPSKGIQSVVCSVSDAIAAIVRHAIMFDTRNAHPTDEVPRRPGLINPVTLSHKSQTKSSGYASEVRTGSPRPHLKGCQKRQSRGRHSQATGWTCSERQNLNVSFGSVWSTGTVSRVNKATKWPDGTSSHQLACTLRNMPQQPNRIRVTVSQS